MALLGGERPVELARGNAMGWSNCRSRVGSCRGMRVRVVSGPLCRLRVDYLGLVAGQVVPRRAPHRSRDRISLMTSSGTRAGCGPSSSCISSSSTASKSIALGCANSAVSAAVRSSPRRRCFRVTLTPCVAARAAHMPRTTWRALSEACDNGHDGGRRRIRSAGHS